MRARVISMWDITNSYESEGLLHTTRKGLNAKDLIQLDRVFMSVTKALKLSLIYFWMNIGTGH